MRESLGTRLALYSKSCVHLKDKVKTLYKGGKTCRGEVKENAKMVGDCLAALDNITSANPNRRWDEYEDRWKRWKESDKRWKDFQWLLHK